MSSYCVKNMLLLIIELYVILSNIQFISRIHLVSGAFTCEGKYNICDIQSWGPWSPCSTKCGKGSTTRSHPLCCNSAVVQPFDIVHCLKYCNISIPYYQKTYMENRRCGVCFNGTYDNTQNKCQCSQGYGGKCCDTATHCPTTKLLKEQGTYKVEAPTPSDVNDLTSSSPLLLVSTHLSMSNRQSSSTYVNDLTSSSNQKMKPWKVALITLAALAGAGICGCSLWYCLSKNKRSKDKQVEPELTNTQSSIPACVNNPQTKDLI